jgi:aryl-alcohol dehydrogenase-like predicted oxidoreductase
MTIPTRVLGRTGVEVSALGYGAMELRGQLTSTASQLNGPAITDEDAGRLLNELLDAGVSLIDTSVDYGRSEELIGRYLSSRRSEFFLASKCGCPVSPSADGVTMGQHDYSAPNVRADVEQSLRRLRTGHLDLVQVHLSPSRDEMAASGTIEALQKLQAEGKVRFIGMSGTLPNLPDHIAMGVFDVFQIPYSALQPEHDELITRAADAKAGVLIRGAVARGTASEDKNWSVQPLSSSGLPAQDRWQAAKLDELLGDGMSRHEFILRFTLSHPGVSSAIVGTSNPDHLRRNVAAASRGALPEDVYAEARGRLAAR